MEGLWNKSQSPSHADTTSSRPAVNLRIFERDLGLGVNRDGPREEPAGKSSRAPRRTLGSTRGPSMSSRISRVIRGLGLAP